MSLLNRLFNVDDVRYHYYYRDIPAGNYTWTHDFSKFPGLQMQLPGEAFVRQYTREIGHASTDYWHYSIYISIGYIVTIFTLKFLMNQREKGFDLKRELILWNWFLAAFSFMGTVRCLPEFWHVLINDGFFASYAKNTYVQDIRINTWYWFFTISKAAELIDTLFIVLRKRRLIQLHWIHHTLTLNYSWFVFMDVPSTARWMVNMNFIVHTFMYSYYALTAMGYRLPRQVNVTLTTLQIVQMLFGFYIHIDCLRLKLMGQPCDVSMAVAVTGFSLYALFFLLFMNFFIRTYIIPNSKKAVKAAMAKKQNNEKKFQ
ncbi:hypothetical protein DERF_004122 [Dermatophagoides farinae]|uniref:Elongation of very long chain fatty acids protein n=1 Tax=Dermatophagoides farinae TaxID=6954 RepID=A0A922IH73_DERFA|nr:elongation of very long chain fatty acids protein 6-like [Dermatophagoides farinae]KAH7638270.1 hypothetical protein HUG17_9376 [Dermatophagoides farinae]KAH9530309.1 hypothetical protein DERF_004122 [Dermatophagoides farinae]